MNSFFTVPVIIIPQWISVINIYDEVTHKLLAVIGWLYLFILGRHTCICICFLSNIRCVSFFSNKWILSIFCERQISIKLFYLYQRLQCTDNYFFKIKFVLFLYLLPSASWKETTCLDIFLLSDRQWGTEHQYLLSRFLHITITYNLLHLRLWYVDVVTEIA